jgi:hypothetical protein
VKFIEVESGELRIHIYFVGDVAVSAQTRVNRGDILGESTGVFPAEPPSDVFNGASMAISPLDAFGDMRDASNPTLWAGGVPSCYVP